MILEAINDNVIIKLENIIDKDIKSKSGIILGQTNKELTKPDRGIVVAVGKGRYSSDGKLIELTVKEGDNIIYNRFAGTEIIQGEEKYLIIKESDILARIK